MNTYGRTNCPNCGRLNTMFRPERDLKQLPVWNEVICQGCEREYKHTDVLEAKSEVTK